MRRVPTLCMTCGDTTGACRCLILGMIHVPASEKPFRAPNGELFLWVDPREPSPPRAFMPIEPGDEGIGDPCAVCEKPMEVGQIPAVLAVGIESEINLERAARGEPYVAAAALAHWGCALRRSMEKRR